MKEDILRAMASMDQYFSIDKLKSDFFEAIAIDYYNADPDDDFDSFDSIVVPIIGTEKSVTVTRDDFFIKHNKGNIQYYIPDILDPIPNFLPNLMWFSVYIKEKQTDEGYKLMAFIGYNQLLELHKATTYEPGRK